MKKKKKNVNSNKKHLQTNRIYKRLLGTAPAVK